jgi:hypothetical protein
MLILNLTVRLNKSSTAQVRLELEHMLESQLQISDRLKEECRKLSQQLQDTSTKSR